MWPLLANSRPLLPCEPPVATCLLRPHPLPLHRRRALRLPPPRRAQEQLRRLIRLPSRSWTFRPRPLRTSEPTRDRELAAPLGYAPPRHYHGLSPSPMTDPPPHLVCMAPIWDTLTPLQMAAMERASLNEVETGLAHAQVSDDPPARTASDQTALDLGTAEHERVAAPLRAELATLGHHYTTECHGLQESATAIKEVTRTHIEREARVASFKVQNNPRTRPSRRSSVSKPPSSPGSLPNSWLRPFPRLMPLRPHSSHGLGPTSRLLSPPLLDSLRLRPTLRLWSLPPSHSLWLWAPPRFQRLPPRRVRPVPQLLPQPGLWYPLPMHLCGTPCNSRLPGNPVTLRALHPGRS